MIECYMTTCKNHSCHFDPEEGPFCTQDHCYYVPTNDYARVYEMECQEYLESYQNESVETP